MPQTSSPGRSNAPRTNSHGPLAPKETLSLPSRNAASVRVAALDFEATYREYNDFVSRIIRRRVSDHASQDDLSQQVWTKVFEHLEQFDCSRGSVPQWLAGIAYHQVADHFRRVGRRKKYERNDTDLQGSRAKTLGSHEFSPLETLSVPRRDPHDDPSHSIEVEQRRVVSTEVLSQLQPKYAEILSLMYIQDLTIPRIALLLEIPEGTVKSRLHAALSSARKVETNRLRKAA